MEHSRKMCKIDFRKIIRKTIPVLGIIFLLTLIIYVSAPLPQNAPVNYTSIALNHLIGEYPTQEIKIVQDNVYKHPETGIEYTYILAKHDGKKIGLVVNHRDNKVYGSHQIRNDYMQYLDSLPRPYRKMSPTLRGKIREKFNGLPASINRTSDETFNVMIFVNDSQNLVKIAKEINSIASFPDVIDDGENKLITTALPLSKIIELADRDTVEVVWYNSKIQASLNFSYSEINADDVNNLGYHGGSINITIIDSGINKTHPNINKSLILDEKNFKNDEYYPNYTDDDNGHGTHVTGIIASNNNTFRGVAYSSNLINAKVLNKNQDGWDGDILEAINYYSDHSNKAPDTDIVQMSINIYGLNPAGDSEISRFLDQKVFVNKILIVVCTGNYGYTIRVPADAYNTISVGATRYNTYYNEWRVWDDSGWGKTTDVGARTKVDVVAPGYDIYSANNKWSTGNWFVKKTGTSMAAPHVSGTVALLYEYARDNNKTVNPLLVKAAILNSAVKIKNWTGSAWSHSSTDPLDLYSGAGQIDALAAYNTFSNNKKLFNSNLTKTGDSHWYILNITNAPVNLSVTLVWNRHETNYRSTTFPEVNDLDIFLWNETNSLQESESEFDTVEHIYYQITTNGTYKIKVYAHNISKTDGWEYYALASSHTMKSEFTKNLVYGWNLISLPMDFDE